MRRWRAKHVPLGTHVATSPCSTPRWPQSTSSYLCSRPLSSLEGLLYNFAQGLAGLRQRHTGLDNGIDIWYNNLCMVQSVQWTW